MHRRTINEIEKELLDAIMDVCQIDDLPPEDMHADSPLIGPDSPLDLDSLDAVEILVMIQEKYGVRITPRETSIEILNSLETIADYILSHTDNIIPREMML